VTTQVVDGVFKTGDMAVAAVLSLHGLSPTFDRRGSRVIFVFRILESEQDCDFITDLLEEIMRNECRVEPRRFARELKHVRDLMYEFLGVTRDSRRLRRD
jgi:hypothetical protein